VLLRGTVTVRHWLNEPSLIFVLLASLFHLSYLMIMFISLKFCISLWRAVGWSIACYLCHVIEFFGTNTFLINHCAFCHLRTEGGNEETHPKRRKTKHNSSLQESLGFRSDFRVLEVKETSSSICNLSFSSKIYPLCWKLLTCNGRLDLLLGISAEHLM